MEHHTSRTIEWKNWGITFMDVQPDQTKDVGKIIGRLSFSVGNVGPAAGASGTHTRANYLAICSLWCNYGVLPSDHAGWSPEVKLQIVSE